MKSALCSPNSRRSRIIFGNFTPVKYEYTRAWPRGWSENHFTMCIVFKHVNIPLTYIFLRLLTHDYPPARCRNGSIDLITSLHRVFLSYHSSSAQAPKDA